MAVNLAPIGNGQQFFDNTGLPLAGGLLYTYQAGSSTPFSTYTTISGNVLNSNPIVLGTDGRPPNEIWLTYGYFYKFILTDSTGTVIGTWDNLYGFIGTASATGATIPTGLISLWSGSIGSIPVGWYLCDGTNGTPDLRDRFVVGAGTTYAVTATGGSTDSVVVSHNHTINSGTTGSSGQHYHGSGSNNGGNGGYDGYVDWTSSAGFPGAKTWIWNGSGGGLGYGPNLTTGNQGTTYAINDAAGDSHTHTFSTTAVATGVSGTNANLPPYYALAYIMKG